MNRYVAAGLLADAHAGKHVLYVGENQSMARHALDVVAREAEQQPAELKGVRRSHGREQVTSVSGGTIRFTGQRSDAVRGMEIDVVYADVHASDHRRSVVERCAPALSFTRGALLLP